MIERRYVLVVEDDTLYGDIYRMKLKKAGIDAEVVSTGDKALQLARANKPALVLLDLILPGKDGFEILREFKNDPSLRDATVIILSNLSQEEDIQRAKDLGATEFCLKSGTSITALISKIQAYLAKA